MEARLKDYDAKRIFLDKWKESQEDIASSKLRYFKNCLPANGENSMREDWGADPNRKEFLQNQKGQFAENWKLNVLRRKAEWKKRSISEVKTNLKIIDSLECGNGKKLGHERTQLEKKMERERKTLCRLDSAIDSQVQFRKRKLENRLKYLEKRRLKARDPHDVIAEPGPSVPKEEFLSNLDLDCRDLFDISLFD